MVRLVQLSLILKAVLLVLVAARRVFFFAALVCRNKLFENLASLAAVSAAVVAAVDAFQLLTLLAARGALRQVTLVLAHWRQPC